MRRLELPRTPVGIAYVLALAGTALTSILLAGALWARASTKPTVVLAGGHDAPRPVTPGVVPDTLAADVARDFVVTLENYVPATVEKNLAFLETRVAPEGVHGFARLAANLKKLVKESKQASQFLAEDPSSWKIIRDGARLEVILHGTRRIFVENALLEEARVAYRVAITPGEPTRNHPTGIQVSGFSVRVEQPEKGHGKNP
jgi:hypothetical protein